MGQKETSKLMLGSSLFMMKILEDFQSYLTFGTCGSGVCKQLCNHIEPGFEGLSHKDTRKK